MTSLGVPLEREIERKVREWAIRNGWLVYKFTSPGTPSVPDRLFIKEGRHVFIEFKRPGGKPTDAQSREHKRLRAAGAAVYVCDDVQDAIDVLSWP